MHSRIRTIGNWRIGYLATKMLLIAMSLRPLISDAETFALLVGINDYPEPRFKLKGCVNDVLGMEALLKERVGVQAENITTLLDAAATAQNIVDAFKRTLIDNVKGPGDTAIFFYAGHGIQIQEIGGLGDEKDGKDEALACRDVNMSSSDIDRANPIRSGLILDDKLGELIAQIPVGTVVTIFDSCYSGTVTKGQRTRGLSERDLIKVESSTTTVPGPDLNVPMYESNRKDVKSAESIFNEIMKPEVPKEDSNAVVITSCSDIQKAKEVSSPKNHGLFTSKLLTYLEGAREPVSYRDLELFCGQKLGSQQPQIEKGAGVSSEKILIPLKKTDSPQPPEAQEPQSTYSPPILSVRVAAYGENEQRDDLTEDELESLISRVPGVELASSRDLKKVMDYDLGVMYQKSEQGLRVAVLNENGDKCLGVVSPTGELSREDLDKIASELKRQHLVRALEKMRSNQSGSIVDLRITSGESNAPLETVRYGDEYSLSLNSEQNGYLTVLYVDSLGEIQPVPITGTEIHAGQDFKLNVEITASDPEGEDFYKVLITPGPVDLGSLHDAWRIPSCVDEGGEPQYCSITSAEWGIELVSRLAEAVGLGSDSKGGVVASSPFAEGSQKLVTIDPKKN